MDKKKYMIIYNDPFLHVDLYDKATSIDLLFNHISNDLKFNHIISILDITNNYDFTNDFYTYWGCFE